MDENFLIALEICGIQQNQPLMDAVTVLQGISDVETVMALTNKEFDQLAVAVNKMQVPQGEPPLVLNQITLKRMKAFRLWLIWRERRDMETDPVDFDPDEMQWCLERMAFEERSKSSDTPDQPQPDKLVNIGFDVWQTFWRQLGAYCGTIRGAMMIPIAYVFRAHTVPTDEILLAQYGDSDEELMATVKLEGPDYQHDCKMVWMILVRLVGGGSAWPFIKHCEATFDAREAIILLRGQSLGSASDSSRRSRAFGILKTTKYTGKSSRFTFNTFIEKLQYAFTELSETDVPQTETQKVQVLMENVQSDLLMATWPVLLKDEELLGNFGQACAYLTNYLAKMQAISGTVNTRTVAATSVATNRTYTDDEWRALTADDKKSIIAKRKADKRKKRSAAGTTSGSGSVGPTTYKGMKRKNAKLTKQIAALKAAGKAADSDDSSGEETVVAGSHASSKKRS